MRLRWGVTALALILCCLGEASTDPNEKETEKPTGPARGRRVLRKTVRGENRKPEGTRPSRDVGFNDHDDDYIVNVEVGFRGNTYRELDVNRNIGSTHSRSRGIGDSRNRGFSSGANDRTFTPAARDRGYASDSNDRGYQPDRGYGPDSRDRGYGPESRDRGYGPETGDRRFEPSARDRGYAPDSKDRGYQSELRDKGYGSEPRDRGFEPSARGRGYEPEARGYDPDRNRADTDPRDTRNYYRSNEGRDSETDRYLTPKTRNFDTSRGRDATDRFDPVRLMDYYRNSNDSKSSDSRRWLNILTEFLKSSSEGRELLRARADQLLVGADVAAGQLPLPLLLVPVPVQDPQCGAPGVEGAPPNRLLEPPVRYIPSDKVTDTPITPAGPRGPLDEKHHETLLQLFREDQPRAPLLPPLLLPESPRPAPAAPLPPLSTAPPPARLRFERSLIIRAELTAYYSDYTEPYTVWYDADTGSSRVDMHGGTTVLYRTVKPNGEVDRTQLRIERYEDEEKRACARLTSAAVDADRAPPGLPDPAPFSFEGYQDTVDGRMERWTYKLEGQAGELGAARGEALVYRHELLVARVAPDFAIPYRYRVTVDSSVLGPEVDWYEHRYLEVREQRPDASYMSIDVERECDAVSRARSLEDVDPLREFSMPHRAARCDDDFQK